MRTEDRLRDAAQAIAATVRDVRPLDLPADMPAPAPVRSRARRRLPAQALARHWPPWLVPLAAATAVVALAATLVAVRSIPGPRPPVSPSSPVPAAPSPSPAPASDAIPRYFVALNLLPNGAAVVGDTRSSRPVATVSLPPDGNRFAGVTGAAGDRAFVLDVAQNPPPDTWSTLTPRVWYLLRIAPGTDHPAQLTRLPIPPTPGNTLVLGIALSPDGSKLAVLFQRLFGSTSFVPGPVTLRIFSVATGATLRTWTGPSYRLCCGETINTGDFDPNTTLTWTAGGRTLAFFYLPMNGSGGVFGMLGLSRPGRDLLAGSKPVTALDFETGCDGLPLLTADGRTAVCGTSAVPSGGAGSCSAVGRDGIGGKPRFVEYSTATGKPVRVLYRYPGTCIDGSAVSYWASPSGDTVIGWLDIDSQFAATNRIEAGLFTAGKFEPLQLHLAVPPNRTGAPDPGPYAF